MPNESGAYNDAGQRVLAGPVPDMEQSPERFIKDSVNRDIKRMQGVFEEQWAMIEKQKKYMGEEQTAAMLKQLTDAAKNKVMMVKAEGQKKIDNLAGIQTLRDQGLLNDSPELPVDKILWGAAAGREVAESMFPKSSDPVDTLKEYGQMSMQEDRVQKDLGEYRTVPGERIPELFTRASKEKHEPDVIQKMNRQATENVKTKNGMITMTGVWEDAPNQDKAAREMNSHRVELNLARSVMKRIRQGEPSSINNLGKLRSLSARMITGQTKVGTLGDKVNASILQRKIGQGKVTNKESARPNIRVKHRATGQLGWVPADEFNEQEYERLQ